MKKSFSLLLFVMVLFNSTLFSQTSWYVQFRNNFTVEDDQIGVGIGYPASSEESPFNYTVYNGQQVNLEAYDNQWVDNNEFKISFNDNEASLNPSRWFISNPGGGGITQ